MKLKTNTRSDVRNPISINNNIPVEEIEQKQHLLILPYQGDRGNYSIDNCIDNYIGEASRRVSERIIDHNGRDRKLHFFKHSVEHNHKNVEKQDFKILGKGYRNNAMKEKILEALYCRELQPTLNQEKSINLKLFN